MLYDSDGLLALQVSDEVFDAVLDDVISEVQDLRLWPYVTSTGTTYLVLGCLVERRMAGEVTPDLPTAVILSGAADKVAAAVLSADAMHLTSADFSSLERRAAVSDVKRSRRKATGRQRTAVIS